MAALPTRQQQHDRRMRVLAGSSRAVEIEALTAAATRATRAKAGMMRRLIQPWQARAMSYYDLVGECWNATQFYSRSLRQVRIYAARRDDSGELVEVEDNEQVQTEVARIQDPGGGGCSQLLDNYGRLRFLIGEGYWLVTNPDGDDEGWEFVSPDELRLTGAGEYTRFAAPSLPAEILVDIPDTAYKPIGDQALIYRSWRPHPRFSLLADSPQRAVLDVLEELVLLTLAVRGTAKSRLVRNGILYVPDELSPPQLGVDGGDEDPSSDPFLELIQEQLVAGIQNPGTAAAVAPALVRGPAEYADAFKWIQVSNPLETYPEEGLRTEAIRRYATGIEMPSEMLTGTADVNHWGAWLIDEQKAKDYIYPVCQGMVDELTAVFLRPALKAAGLPDWDEYVIGYDAAAIVAHPDRGKDAKDDHDRLVISDEALRNATGFNDGDAPSAEEWSRRAALKMLDPSALTDPYVIPETPAVNEDEQQTGAEGGPDAPASGQANEVEAGAPSTQPNGEVEQLAIKRGFVLGACMTSVIRARAVAGSRLRSIVRAADAKSLAVSATPADQLADVPQVDLAAKLGPEWVRSQGRSEIALVAGADLELRHSLAMLGVNGLVGDRLAELVTQHAARTLFQPRSRVELPRSITAYIQRVIT